MPSLCVSNSFVAVRMLNLCRWLWALVLAVAAPKTWAAGAATATAAGVAATAAGIDPWPWVIGGFGAAIVYVKRPAASKPDAVINAMISVLIGGIISPWAAAGVAEYLSPRLANNYALAFMLSSLWPWLVPVALDKFKKMAVPATQGSGES